MCITGSHALEVNQSSEVAFACHVCPLGMLYGGMTSVACICAGKGSCITAALLATRHQNDATHSNAMRTNASYTNKTKGWGCSPQKAPQPRTNTMQLTVWQDQAILGRLESTLEHLGEGDLGHHLRRGYGISVQGLEVILCTPCDGFQHVGVRACGLGSKI